MKKVNTVLLIDDNDADNEYHELVISGTGRANRLNSVTDSRDALKCWKENCSEPALNAIPDLVFLDINMPAINGFELLDRIKQTPDPNGLKSKMKIFMLTTSQNPEDHHRATNQYADMIMGFYTKPLTTKVFEKIVEDHF
jgi:CheY-like chemotaxis protein